MLLTSHFVCCSTNQISSYNLASLILKALLSRKRIVDFETPPVRQKGADSSED